MSKLEQLLRRDSSEFVLMDGGMGSTIEDRGVDVRNEMWGSYCLLDEQGRRINDAVHSEFAEAGARLLIANSHNVELQACRRFLEAGVDDAVLPEQVRASVGEQRAVALHRWLLETATDSVRRVAAGDPEIAVASCVGSLEPLGPYATESQFTTEEACRALEFELVTRLASDVDLIIFETLTTRQEIEGLALACRQHPTKHLAVGLTCVADGRTAAGLSMAEVVEILQPAAPLVYFIQCTPFSLVHAALESLVAAVGDEQAVGVYANDGRVWRDRRWHGDRTPAEVYADEAARWQQMGARVIGGCCGTSPLHIAELRRRNEDD